MKIVLQQVSSLIDNKNNNNTNSNAHRQSAEESLTILNEKLSVLTNMIDQTHVNTHASINLLKNTTESFGANYYWLVFVVIYGGLYLFQ